jgi:predicted P-loop ATPase
MEEKNRGAEALETSVGLSNVEHPILNFELKNEEEIKEFIRRLFKEYSIRVKEDEVEFLDLSDEGKEVLSEVYKSNNNRVIKLIDKEIIRVKEEDKNKNKLVIQEEDSDYLEEIENIKALVDKEGVSLFVNPQNISLLALTDKGVVKNTQSNYTVIVKNDKYIQSHVRYNELKQTLEFDGKMFTDDDCTIIATYISRVYGLENRKTLSNTITRDNVICYNPVKVAIEDGIEDFKLDDGESYIDEFFEKICNRTPRDEDDAIYQREVARMIFYGGINRLYRPGCKFDYMPIFVGPQGCGKSSVVDWLNPIRSSYVDLRTIDGKEAIELIQGGFVIELSELLAFVRAKDAESMKSFVTRCVDKYRVPYKQFSEERPRTCLLIGTTNDAAFLTDVTGNRRYLPIGLYDMSPKYIYDNLDYVKDYINKCWKEALILMRKGKTYLHIPYEYNDIINRNRDAYTLEDPLFEEIRDYVNNPDADGRCSPWRICAKELYERCANGLGKCPTYMFKQFRNIMSTMDGWVWDTSKPHHMKGYQQKQKCWINNKLREQYSTYKSDEDDE